MKIDIRSEQSLYVEIDGITVYLDTSVAQADGDIFIDHWYVPVKTRKDHDETPNGS